MIGLRALLGIFPNTGEYESKRVKLEEEFQAILDYGQSPNFKAFLELEKYVHSEEFALGKRNLLGLRFEQTPDFQKEKECRHLAKSKDIKLFYKTRDSKELKEFRDTEKSGELKKYNELEKNLASEEFKKAKHEASLSSKEKFAKSDLAKTLQQYEQKNSNERIKGYYRFINNKLFKDYENGISSGLAHQIATFEKETSSASFQDKLRLLSKADLKNSEEKKKIDTLARLKKSKAYRNYIKMASSSDKKYYDELHGSSEIEAFAELKKFITSPEYKRQRKEIENRTFKDTPEFQLQKSFEQLKNSDQIKHYFKFNTSNENKNIQQLEGSERIRHYEELQAYIKTDEFLKNKTYCELSPKKRWNQSDVFAKLNEYEQLKKSEKIRWFYKNIEAKKFVWFRIWKESFMDDFANGKLDDKKWITRYFYGEEILKDSYSLSHDKHFLTNGKNLDFSDSTLRIITRKEHVKGKSWHPVHGFITRNFNYTSGLISTGKSFRQKYGTFEAKIKFYSSDQVQNAFWMVSKTMLPHIDVAKANGKIVLGNAWGDSRNLKTVKKYTKKMGRSKFAADYFIYTLEWTPEKLIWKINGLEVASTNQGIPQEPMYVVLSSGLNTEVEAGLPAQMEIDWVRCFQHEKFLQA